MRRELNPDQHRGKLSDQKDDSFGQDGRRYAARTRQAVDRAAVAYSRIVTVGLEARLMRGQDERS
jgi:hypothetical protein